MNTVQRKLKDRCQPLKPIIMRKFFPAILALIAAIVIISCSKTGSLGDKLAADYAGGVGAGVAGGGGGGGGNPGGSAGLLTAGEWNDLDNWSFWKILMERDTIKTYPALWGFYSNNRVTINLTDASNQLVHDALISLVCNGITIKGRTDNFGKAELFPGLLQPGFSLSDFTLTAQYRGQTFNLGSYSPAQNPVHATIPVNKSVNNTLDIMFVVDATGSMGDELSYLKTELKDVVNRAGSQLPGVQLRMASVFYRDVNDDYVTKPFNFTTSSDQLNNFINGQSAGGGGDYPEAVDEALKVSIQDMQWSSNAVNRLLFLVLDAPPHQGQDNLTKIKTAITEAQQKGIRVIPVSASGINWETEFFLRFLSVSTNSTYVFITDHSGIGGPHLTPTVGNYQVEFLNNLMVRLITKYGENHN
jgi:hypothetical protein